MFFKRNIWTCRIRRMAKNKKNKEVERHIARASTVRFIKSL